jgi:uncharacterized protein YihD (DUF1040 family)
MRDPNRIGPILASLQAAWEKYPDMRLGQLIECAHDQACSSADLFNIEDDRLADGIEKFIHR